LFDLRKAVYPPGRCCSDDVASLWFGVYGPFVCGSLSFPSCAFRVISRIQCSGTVMGFLFHAAFFG
jgi:hypothetical protein